MEHTSDKVAQMNELDAVIGTSTRIPRLYETDMFDEWKERFPQWIQRHEPKLWRCFLKGPTKVYETSKDKQKEGTSDLKEKEFVEYTDADWEMVEQDQKAYATLTMALAPVIAQGFRQYKDAKSLWEALMEVYDGNEDMKESRQDSLRQKFNMFNHVLGESLERQMQRFAALNTKLSAAYWNRWQTLCQR